MRANLDVPAIAVAALIVAFGLSSWIGKVDEGTGTMVEIAGSGQGGRMQRLYGHDEDLANSHTFYSIIDSTPLRSLTTQRASSTIGESMNVTPFPVA